MLLPNLYASTVRCAQKVGHVILFVEIVSHQPKRRTEIWTLVQQRSVLCHFIVVLAFVFINLEVSALIEPPLRKIHLTPRVTHFMC